MVNNELYTRVSTAKAFLNNELVKLKTASDTSPIAYREINDRLDLIHEIERIGYRNLSDRDIRKLNRVLNVIEVTKVSNN